MSTVLKINYKNLGTLLIKPIETDVREDFVDGVVGTSALGEIKKQLFKDITDLPVEVVDEFAKIIVNFSRQLTSQFVGVFESKRNPKISVEFSLSITTGLDLQLASASGEGAIKVSISLDA